MEETLLRGLSPGAVLLLHDGEGTGGRKDAVANMRRALRPFLRKAADSGWTFATLGSLLSKSRW
jgi:hypothetical protein